MLEESFRLAKRVNLKSGKFEQANNGFANRRIVVNETNDRNRDIQHTTNYSVTSVKIYRTLVGDLAGCGTSAFRTSPISSATEVICNFCIKCPR